MLIENNIAKIFSIRYDINIFRLKNNFRNGGIVIMNNNNEKNNIKMTKNRKIILETIDRYNAPITAEELFFCNQTINIYESIYCLSNFRIFV